MTHAGSLPRPLSAVAFAPVVLAIAAAWIVLILVPSSHGAAAFSLMWVAMTVAMMVPTVLRPMQRAAAGSSRRAWLFIAGFVVLWLVAGVPAYLLMNAVTWTPAWIWAAWMLAGAYQLTPWMRRNLTDCRSVRFDGRPFAYGLRQGTRCISSCGALMLAAMVTAMAVPSALLAVAVLGAITVVICWEKDPRTHAQALAVVGVAMLLGGAVGFVVLGGGSGAPHHLVGTSTS